MSEYLLFAIIIIQWLFLAWIIVRFGAERMKLSEEREKYVEMITNMNYALNNRPNNPEYAPSITMPHPVTGTNLEFQHYGNGQYGPSPESAAIINNVEEVEGAME